MYKQMRGVCRGCAVEGRNAGVRRVVLVRQEAQRGVPQPSDEMYARGRSHM